MPIDSVQIRFDANAVWALNICLAIIMLGVACDLTLKDFRGLLQRPKSAILGIISQFVLLPFFTFLVVLALEPQPSIALGMMMVAACPGGNISNFFTHLSGGNVALSMGLTAFATFTAVFLTPFNFHFWGSQYEPTRQILTEVSVEPSELVKTIGLILVIPLIIGMTFRHFYSKKAQWLSQKLRVVSILLFLAIVVIAFMKNFDLFLEYIHFVLGIVLIHNAVAILTGFGIGKFFRLPLADVKTLTIETGIQNSGLGLLLVFSFFDGLGGMAIIVAWWGIWHIVTGLVLGAIWSRKAKMAV